MADDQSMDQNDIEQLLESGKNEAASAPPEQPPAADAASPALDQSEIESLLSGGTQAAGLPAVGQQDALPDGQGQPQSAEAKQAAGPNDAPFEQDGVEQLLQQAGTALTNPEPQAPSEPQAPAPSPRTSGLSVGEGSMLPSDVDFLLQQAEEALESVNPAATGDLPDGVSAFSLEEFTGAPASTENATLDLIRDVELDLRIELGRTHMYLEDVLRLRKGSVVPLDKLAGDPVDIYVNGRLIARGEVLVLSDNFCVRVAELIAGTSTSA